MDKRPNSPQVTVVICNYNYDQYVEQAIVSAVKQTYENLKIVIVDDCSTDDSIDNMFKLFNIKEWEIKEDHHRAVGVRVNGREVFILALNENVGPSEARNAAIECSIENTDYFLILDADDQIHPEKAKILVNTALQSKSVGVVYADYDILNVETGNVVREYKEPFDKLRLLQDCIVHSGSLISSKALQATEDEFGYYDREMRTCEDYDLWMRISEQFVIFHVPEPLTLVRNHKNNSTFSVEKEIWQRNWQRIKQKTSVRNDQKKQIYSPNKTKQ